MGRDPSLDVLLDLHGTRYYEDNGYWYEIQAWRVTPTASISHGIRYNLTLHDDCNQRILGFDNAHAPKARKNRKYQGRIVEYDHVHQNLNDPGTPYAFTSAQHLLADFFERVNQILGALP